MFWEPYGNNYELNARFHRDHPHLYKLTIALKLGWWIGLCGLLIYCGHTLDRVGQTMIERERAQKTTHP
jgi:hypothetical protein